MAWYNRAVTDIEEITGGYSGAKLLRLRSGQQDYCIKIMPERLSEGSAERVKEICELYRKAGINSLSLKGYGNLETENRHFYIYDYIVGESFKAYSERELTETEIRAEGERLGKQLKHLKTLQDVGLATDQIEKLTDYGEERYRELAEDTEVSKLMREYFEMGQVEGLMREFRETTEVFRGLKPALIHGDLKRSNMVRSEDGVIYLIDIESMRKSYDVLNLRYQMSWIMFTKAAKERAFVRGIFDGLYDGRRPAKFNAQLRYVLMLNFAEHTRKAWRRGEDLREYFREMQAVFQRVAESMATGEDLL